jgi:GDP-L-fucose synthase
MDLKDKCVLVTGGHGFLGKWVVHALKEKRAYVFVPSHGQFDLRRRRDVQEVYRLVQPNVVIHLAARCGGIGANQKDPGGFLYDNLLMGLEMMEEALNHNIEKYVQIGTVCAYPKVTPVPFKESDLWNGYPEETNAPYGLAKKMLLVQAQAYRAQHGLNAIYLLPANLYGPGDNFDLETSHVIPAMIRKFLKAKESGAKQVTLWGTGSASREFLYVGDCAEAIIKATELYDGADPVNIGTGIEFNIAFLAKLIKGYTGFEGKIVWDGTYPDGQPRRSLDTTQAAEKFGFTARTSLERGVEETIKWYLSTLDSNK